MVIDLNRGESTVSLPVTRERGLRFEAGKKLTYKVIENTRPGNYDNLIVDLSQRTGLSVERVEVDRIDFLRDTAQVRIFYDEPDDARVRSDMSSAPERAVPATDRAFER
jgi:hypothetical protein